MCRIPVSDVITALLVVTFGTSTWVALGGLWVELPLLTNLGIPEGYTIGSYFIIVTQLAVIGPLLFIACQSFAPRGCQLEVPAIYALLVVGASASFLLIWFWHNYTIWVDGAEHSTAFLILVLFMALVDSTSNITFLPFISSLKQKYTNWYFIGEGLSSVIPSFIVLIQGTGGDDECVVNSTFVNISYIPENNASIVQNCTIWDIERNGYNRFPPSVYYICIFILFTLSALSFCILRCVPALRNQYDNSHEHESSRIWETEGVDERTPLVADISGSGNIDDRYDIRQKICSIQSNNTRHNDRSAVRTDDQTERETTLQPNDSPVGNPLNDHYQDEDISSIDGGQRSDTTDATASSRSCIPPKWHVVLYVVLTVISAMTYGILPSIQGYSAAAYGSHIYLLATTFAEISVPIGFFLVMIRPTTDYLMVLVSALIGMVAGAYCILTACLSPDPPLLETTPGKTLIVLAWIFQGVFFSYCRATICGILRGDSDSRTSMMWFGSCTTFGTMLGALVMFPLVTSLDLFRAYDPTEACAENVTCEVSVYNISFDKL